MTQIELIEGTTRDHALSQFFTPPKLAQRLVEWAGVSPFMKGPRITRVLEPSAGNGAIVRPLVAAGAEVVAVEIDTRYLDELRALDCVSWVGCDFIKLEAWPHVDLVCGNFPFHLDLDGSFTLHALKFAPRVVAIYPSNVFYSEQRSALWNAVRPTRIAYMSKRAWPGATDYVALELVGRSRCDANDQRGYDDVRVEWWSESWT